jgi:hypothetical protein
MIQWNKNKTKDSNMLSNSFKWKQYEGEIILLNVRCYLKYPLIYRNLKEMMIERGVLLQKIWQFYKISEKHHKLDIYMP